MIENHFEAVHQGELKYHLLGNGRGSTVGLVFNSNPSAFWKSGYYPERMGVGRGKGYYSSSLKSAYGGFLSLDEMYIFDFKALNQY